jgi:thymidylate synthase ThyX
MTHRVFSRNASSSRAIPVERLIEDLKRDPVMPVFWGSNKPGMQAGEELQGGDKIEAQDIWLEARDDAIFAAKELIRLGLHKQIANRILEPWCHINVVVTATEWDNFFALRCHPDAQPEMRVLAEAIRDARDASKPKPVGQGEWHLPYITESDYGSGITTDTLVKCSVARCARVSYLTHEMKTPSIEEDLKLYERLVGAQPIHASPAEHQARPDNWVMGWVKPDLHGNFKGWIQYRKTLPNENIKRYVKVD